MTNGADGLLSRLAESLAQAIRESWRRAVAEHGNERLYVYVLFTEPLLGYVVPSFNSEAALQRAVKQGGNEEDLRWHPVEWEYHGEHEELFARPQEILGQLGPIEGHDEDDWETWQRRWEERWRVFVGALKALDAEGLFGAPNDREQLTVNIMWGDEDAVQHVQSARELNSLRSYLRYARSQLARLEEWEAEIEEIDNEHREEALSRIKATIATIKNDIMTTK